MKKVFFLLARKIAAESVATLFLFALISVSVQKVFAFSSQLMGPTSVAIFILLFLGYCVRSTRLNLHIGDQWPLLLPVPRRQLLVFSFFHMLFSFLMAIFLAIGSVVFIAFFYRFDLVAYPSSSLEPPPLDLMPLLKGIALVRNPELSAAIGASFLAVFAFSVLGFSHLHSMQQWSKRPVRPWSAFTQKEKLTRVAFLLGLGMLAPVSIVAPNLLPWIGLTGFALAYPFALRHTFSLSKRQARSYAFAILQGPALVLAAYFFAMLEAQYLSGQEARRDIASVYTHSLVGRTLMPERRKLQLKDAHLNPREIHDIRQDYRKAYGRRYYSPDFPVSFADAIRTKTSIQALEAALEGYDSLHLSDSDAELYLAKRKELNAIQPRHSDFSDLKRFHPSEALTLRLLSATDPLAFSFGLYFAPNAPATRPVREALIALTRRPGLNDEHTRNLVFALSVHFRRHITIAEALRGGPKGLAAAPVQALDCESFRKKNEQELHALPLFFNFVNVCLRDSELRRPLELNDYYGSTTIQREWVSRSSQTNYLGALHYWIDSFSRGKKIIESADPYIDP